MPLPPIIKKSLIGLGVAELGLFATGLALNATRSHALQFGDVGAGTAPPGEAESVAAEMIGRIDWTQPSIVIWVPGICSPPGVRPEFAAAADGVASPHWLGALEYPRYADIDRNVPIGARALELVLDEIRRRDPDGTRYNVAVAAESLGAIVASRAMQTDAGSVIDRAEFFGTPAAAPTIPRELADRVVNHQRFWDPIATPFIGWSHLWSQAGDAGFGAGPRKFPALVAEALLNPYAAAVTGVTTLQFKLGGHDGYLNHPHNYWQEMPAAAQRLIAG